MNTMWKTLKNTDYYMCIDSKNDFEIIISDFISIWITSFSKVTFLQYLKDSNPGLEMPADAMLEKGMVLISDPTNLKNVDIKVDDTQLIVFMTKLFGYPFKLRLKLDEGSKKLFFHKVTKPMLQVIQDLKLCKIELCNILKKKDSEIDEYKCEGGEIVLRHLKTKKFNEQDFLNLHTVYENCFGAEEMLDSLIEKDVNTSMVLKLENGVEVPNTKTEPESQDTEVKLTVYPSTMTVKSESNNAVKRELLPNLINPKKKIKKLNL